MHALLSFLLQGTLRTEIKLAEQTLAPTRFAEGMVDHQANEWQAVNVSERVRSDPNASLPDHCQSSRSRIKAVEKKSPM